MVGHVYIEGQIGTSHNEDGTVEVRGVELQDVISQVKRNGEVEKTVVHINSVGGYVEVGRRIANYLSVIPNCHTIAEAQCASIATEIHLAVPLANRSVVAGSEYMIHLPMFQLQRGTSLNRDELTEMSDQIGRTTTEMVSMYAKATGMDKKALEMLMQQETALTAEQCKEFGFANEIITTPMKAVALLTLTKKDDIMSKLAEEVKAMRLQIASFIAGKAVALDLETKDGMKITIETEADAPVVGDKVMSEDGLPVADGTYEMPMGSIVVVGGVITEVLEPVEEEPAVDVAALKTENEALKAENEEVKVAIEALKKDVQAMAKLQSTYKPKAVVTAFKKSAEKEPTEKDNYNAIKEARKVKLTNKK